LPHDGARAPRQKFRSARRVPADARAAPFAKRPELPEEIMTDSSTAIAAAPFVVALQPILTAAATTIVGAAVTFAVALFAKYTGVTLQASYVETLRGAAETEAGAAVAEAADNLAGRSIPVDSPIVVAAAARIGAGLPDFMKAAGVTPDDVARLVAGEIGKLQAQTPALVAAPAQATAGAPQETAAPSAPFPPTMTGSAPIRGAVPA
jgi:hypothetical protein